MPVRRRVICAIEKYCVSKNTSNQMTDLAKTLLSAEALKAVAGSETAHCACPLKNCQGWESVSEDRWPADHMQAKGTLREALPEGQMEPTFEEFHPNGTRYDSPLAPIAPKYFPYNRCDVFGCTKCGCGVLKYTEYGGYYIDCRVRLIDPELVVNP